MERFKRVPNSPRSPDRSRRTRQQQPSPTLGYDDDGQNLTIRSSIVLPETSASSSQQPALIQTSPRPLARFRTAVQRVYRRLSPKAQNARSTATVIEQEPSSYTSIRPSIPASDLGVPLREQQSERP